jgi:hypothetical protein
VPGIERLTPPRIKEYARYDLYTAATDWFDRLAAPISNSYDEPEIRAWYERAGLTDIQTERVEDSWIWAIGTRGGSCAS